MKENGHSISSMDSVSRSGSMAPNTKATTAMDKNKAKANSRGLTVIIISAISIRIIFRVMEHTHGPMEGATRANGSTIRCKARVPSTGPMVARTRVTTLTIKKKDMAFSSGRMVENSKELGKMVFKRDSPTSRQLKAKPDKDYGRAGRESNGSNKRAKRK